MKSRRLATWIGALVVVVVLASAIAGDVWLFLLPTVAALAVTGVMARVMSRPRKR